MAQEELHDRSQLYNEAIGALLGELLADGLPVRLQVTGSSMSPFVRSGDVVTVQPTSQAPARFGDVVAVLLGSRRLVVHRVVGGRGGSLLTRGDARQRPDSPVASHEVLGRIVAIERGGRPVRLALSPARLLIAALSRIGLLFPLLWPVRRLLGQLSDRARRRACR